MWSTCKVGLPHLVEAGGGSIVLTGSTAGITGTPTVHHTAAKHGVVGVMRTLADESAQHSVRVDSVHPTGVGTLMIQNEKTWRLFLPDDPHPTREAVEPAPLRGRRPRSRRTRSAGRWPSPSRS